MDITAAARKERKVYANAYRLYMLSYHKLRTLEGRRNELELLQCLHYKTAGALNEAKAEAKQSGKPVKWQKEIDRVTAQVSLVKAMNHTDMSTLKGMGYFGNGAQAYDTAQYSDSEEDPTPIRFIDETERHLRRNAVEDEEDDPYVFDPNESFGDEDDEDEDEFDF